MENRDPPNGDLPIPIPIWFRLLVASCVVSYEMVLTAVSLMGLSGIRTGLMPGGDANGILETFDPDTKAHRSLACWAVLSLLTWVVVSHTWTLFMHIVPGMVFLEPARIRRSRTLIRFQLLGVAVAAGLVQAAFGSRTRDTKLRVYFFMFAYVFMGRIFTWFLFHQLMKSERDIILETGIYLDRFCGFVFRFFDFAVGIIVRIYASCWYKFYVQIKF